MRESDGFALAEIDLRLRGEGELVGTRQSGGGAVPLRRIPARRGPARARAALGADVDRSGRGARRAGARTAGRPVARTLRAGRAGSDSGVEVVSQALSCGSSQDAIGARVCGRRVGRRPDRPLTGSARRCSRFCLGRRSSRARPVRRLRGAGDRGAVAGRRFRRVRRLGTGRGGCRASQPRGARTRGRGQSASGDRLPRGGSDPRGTIRSRLPGSPIPAREYGLGPELSVALTPVLAKGARVVAESDRRSPLALDLPLADERRYGDTLIRIHGAR